MEALLLLSPWILSPKGEIFGIVGPNGAGKTTTLKMLSGLIIPSLGSIKIQGLDMGKNSQENQTETWFPA